VHRFPKYRRDGSTRARARASPGYLGYYPLDGGNAGVSLATPGMLADVIENARGRSGVGRI
jgi:hypothetical protein